MVGGWEGARGEGEEEEEGGERRGRAERPGEENPGEYSLSSISTWSTFRSDASLIMISSFSIFTCP